MRKAKVQFRFTRLYSVKLYEFANNVYQRMNHNHAFIKFQSDIEMLGDGLETYHQNMAAASDGSRIARKIFDESRSKLLDCLRRVALQLDLLANGVESTIVDAGFIPVKQPAPRVSLRFKVTHAKNHGSLILKHIGIRGSKAYIWQIAEGPLPENDALWKTISVTVQSKTVVANLSLGKFVWFRATAITRHETLPYSNPIQVVVA